MATEIGIIIFISIVAKITEVPRLAAFHILAAFVQMISQYTATKSIL